jgi:5'-nucleotidase
VKLKITGKILLEALENAVGKYPELEGRFVSVSGIKFGFDPSKEAGQRIDQNSIQFGNGKEFGLENEYILATADYLMFGKDGFDCFLQGEILVNEENALTLKQIAVEFFGKKNCKGILNFFRIVKER